MEGIRRQQKVIYDGPPSGHAETYQEQVQEYMRFQLQLIKGLKLRASSNHERLRNEMKMVIKPLSSFLLSTPAPGIKLTRAGIQLQYNPRQLDDENYCSIDRAVSAIHLYGGASIALPRISKQTNLVDSTYHTNIQMGRPA
jgi:hypothetical protein